MTKPKDYGHISGKTPVIFREMLLFPNLSGIFPFKFNHSEMNMIGDTHLKRKIKK